MRTSLHLAILRTGALAIAVGLLLGAGAALAAGEPGLERFQGQHLVSLEWSGNTARSADELGAATGWVTGALFDDALWRNLAPRVQKSYATLGYLDCRVTDVTLEKLGGGVAARVQLDEGVRYRLGTIGIEGATGLTDEEIREELGFGGGDYWSPGMLEEGINRLLEHYADGGRPFTQVHLRSVSVRDGVASLDLLVVESDTVWVDAVVVTGLHQTREHVVGRFVDPLIGQPYDSGRAAEARAEMMTLGVFARVSQAELELSSPGHGRLVYQVEEARANAFEGAFGYQGQGQGAVGFARLHVGNLAGTARQADVIWEGRGQGVSLFDLHYREPFVLGTGVRADLNFSQELQGEAYTRTNAGLSGSFGVGRGTEATLGLETGRVVVGVGPVAQSNRWGVRLGLTRGAGVPLASLGSLRMGSTRFGLLAGLDFLGEKLRSGGKSEGRLTTLGADGGISAPMAANRFLSLALQTRLRFGDDPTIPIYDLLPLGGVQSLRGYREDAFRAAHLALLRAEYGLLFSRSRLFLFLDQAVFYRALESLDSTGRAETRYRAGYGLGTSYFSPLGELALLLGWGEGTRPLDAKLHLQLFSRF
jgi:outer membrane protein assembly factor BamA